MDIAIFPSNNKYFSLGIEAFCQANSCRIRSKPDITVVSIASWSLKEVVLSSFIEKPESGDLVIISQRTLLPLARYYQRTSINVESICEESESLQMLDNLLRNNFSNSSERTIKNSHLTDKEFISLRYALAGRDAKEQARSMGLCVKTIFCFRHSLAKKLQVRKLSDLLSH